MAMPIIKKIFSRLDNLDNKFIYFNSPELKYNTTTKFFTLPQTTGIHSYLITGSITYSQTALYSNVLLLVTQVDNNVKIDMLTGSPSNVYTSEGIDLYVKNMEAQSILFLYGACITLK